MLGAMQDWDLLVTHVIDHAARETPTREIVTHWADGSETRTDWAGIRRDALKMGQALEALGIQKGDRVVIYLPMIPAAATTGPARGPTPTSSTLSNSGSAANRATAPSVTES